MKTAAQSNDSTDIKKHSPKKATIMSAVLPGAGQFYNRKYWKIPVIYTGYAALGYFFIENNNRYIDYKKALKYRTDDDPLTVDQFPLYSEQGLLQAKNYYRRNVELTVIFSVILYALNVVDAAVDAHLFNFDINDDLSLKFSADYLQPAISNKSFTPAFKLTYNFNSKK